MSSSGTTGFPLPAPASIGRYLQLFGKGIFVAASTGCLIWDVLGGYDGMYRDAAAGVWAGSLRDRYPLPELPNPAGQTDDDLRALGWEWWARWACSRTSSHIQKNGLNHNVYVLRP